MLAAERGEHVAQMLKFERIARNNLAATDQAWCCATPLGKPLRSEHIIKRGFSVVGWAVDALDHGVFHGTAQPDGHTVNSEDGMQGTHCCWQSHCLHFPVANQTYTVVYAKTRIVFPNGLVKMCVWDSVTEK